jgi:hypothetical protein
VDLPPNYIAKTLTGFCVCHFKNTKHAPDALPHYHMTVPISDDSSLLLCVITSQVENKLWYYRKTSEKALSCLVRVDKSNLSFLKRESIIECNQPLLIRKNEFDKIVDSNYKLKVVLRDIPSDIKEKIVKAIKDSPIVKPFIKKLIKYP